MVLVNKPDSSDESRGQLTVGVDTCYLLQTQPLGLESGKLVKPILFPHLRLIKNEFQWFSGYLVHPPGFSSCHRDGKLLAEHIQVRILGHTGQILGSYLRDLL
jgi:hypothetical protein